MAYLKPQTPLKDLNSGDYFYPLTTIDQIITGTSRLSAFMSESNNLLHLSNIGNLNVNGNTTINGNLTVSGAISGNSSSTTKLLNTRTIWGQNFNGTQNISGDMADVGPSIRLPSGQANFDFLTSTGGAANGKFGRILLSGNYSQGNITDYKLYVDGGSSYFNGQIYISYNTTATLGIDSNLKIGTAQKNIHIATRNGTNSGINDGYAAGITFGDSDDAYAGIYYQSSGNYGSRLHFATTGSYANGAYTRMFISSEGYVGIGTITPSEKLHVSGGVIAITHNGNTVTIGSLNTAWCHFQNSANIPFYFNNKISVDGDLLPYTNNNRYLGNSSHYWSGIYGRVYCTNIGTLWVGSRDNAIINCDVSDSTSSVAYTLERIRFSAKTYGMTAERADATYGICGWNNSRTANGYDGYFYISGDFYFRCNTRIYNAVWNDFAEFRQGETIEGGKVVFDDGTGIMKITTKRLQAAARIVSDTYGMAVGESDTAHTPIGIGGRVLAYTYQDRCHFKIGDAVCAAPNGTIDIMTREEIKEYPDRIIGIVSEIPNYEVWYNTLEKGHKGKAEVKVNGRIWVYVR